MFAPSEALRAFSTTAAISATSTALTLGRGPTFINPTLGSTTSAPSLTWTNHPSIAQAKYIRLYHRGDKAIKVEAFVGAEENVAYKRFDALGWTVPPGAYSLTLYTFGPFPSMNDFVAPNAAPWIPPGTTSRIEIDYTYAP